MKCDSLLARKPVGVTNIYAVFATTSFAVVDEAGCRMIHKLSSNTFHQEHVGDLLQEVDSIRIEAAAGRGAQQKSALGQFFTPAPIARLMASMFTCSDAVIRILDAGAGVGSLFAAVMDHLCNREELPEQIYVSAYEIDSTLLPYLQETMRLCHRFCEQRGILFVGDIVEGDFIQSGVERITGSLFSSLAEEPLFNCAILNPPYKKIQTSSIERKLLQQIGGESSNLYSSFLTIASRLLAPSGELVAITPRSFCNGPYFQNFRKFLLNTLSIRRFHVFNSRSSAFNEDNVLQENIILHAVKDCKKPESIAITSTTDMQDELVLFHKVRYDEVVHPDDPQMFIHIMQDEVSHQIVEVMRYFQSTLEELGLQVSTGRVVDFRAKEFLRPAPEENTVPLLFPAHIRDGAVVWPRLEIKKPNALLVDVRTQALLVPSDYYVLVKRFSAKEEKKRIVAVMYDPACIPYEMVGFENHLNYFHCNGKGLAPLVAKGLAVFLNSTLVDEYFRQFNGHTQVNATDLRTIKYPDLQQLEVLGRHVPAQFPGQKLLDEMVQELLPTMADIESQEHNPIYTRQK